MVKKMKMKRKILAIWIVALFFAISMSHAEASESSEIVENEPILVEFGSIASDGTFTAEAMFISEEDLAELETAIALFMDNIVATNDFDGGFLKDLLEKIFGNGNPLLESILGIFTTLRLTRTRGFVISSGHGRDYTPLKKISFKIRRKVAVWHYNSNGLVDDRTIIVKPLALRLKILRGRQVGIMTKFLGVYLSVSRGFLSNSYTFFMGTARHINGFDFSPDL
jgi:hypothetical protein